MVKTLKLENWTRLIQVDPQRKPLWRLRQYVAPAGNPLRAMAELWLPRIKTTAMRFLRVTGWPMTLTKRPVNNSHQASATYPPWLVQLHKQKTTRLSPELDECNHGSINTGK